MVQNAPPQSDNQGSIISKSQKQTQFDKPKIIKGEYIVKFKNQFDGRISENIAVEVSELRNQVLSTFNIQQDSIIAEYNYAFKGFAAKLSNEQVQALKKDSRIARITPNALFKLAIVSSKKTFVNTSFMGQTVPWGVNRVGGPLDGTGKKAWILDTGIDLDNPDLNVDTNNSASFIANENADDQVGHGTHVAGIIAAKNNSIDVVGVAAGATVVAVKVCNNLPPEDPESGCPTSYR